MFNWTFLNSVNKEKVFLQLFLVGKTKHLLQPPTVAIPNLVLQSQYSCNPASTRTTTVWGDHHAIISNYNDNWWIYCQNMEMHSNCQQCHTCASHYRIHKWELYHITRQVTVVNCIADQSTWLCAIHPMTIKNTCNL